MNLPRRRKAPRMGLREKPQWRSTSYLQYVRRFECLIGGLRGHQCGGVMHAHHVRQGTDGTQEEKPSDWFTVPLCNTAHDEVHRGHDTFERKYGVDLLSFAAKLWWASPHRKRYEQKAAAQ